MFEAFIGVLVGVVLVAGVVMVAFRRPSKRSPWFPSATDESKPDSISGVSSVSPDSGPTQGGGFHGHG